MKNTEVVLPDGDKGWVSRSVAVVAKIILISIPDSCKGNLSSANPKEIFTYVLAIKRGTSGDEVGKWCLPCGYLDYDETTEEALLREVYEESGLNLTSFMSHPPQLVGINSDPNSSKYQNVSLIYEVKEVINYSEWTKLHVSLTPEFSEPDEIEDIELIPILEINNYEWAFNHHLYLL